MKGKMILVSLLGLFVLGLMNKCINAQEVPIFFAALDEHIQGQTVCNNDQQIAIIINSQVDVTDTAQLRIIVNHELVHVGQLRKIGNCQLAAKEYAKNPLLKEISAYCEEIKIRSKLGNPVEVLARFVTFMTNQYGIRLGLNFDQILDLTDELCLSRREDDSS